MPALADNAIVNRLEPETRDAILICAAPIARLSNEEQRTAVAVLMAAVKLGELRVAERTH
jgi:hypothetical protein